MLLGMVHALLKGHAAAALHAADHLEEYHHIHPECPTYVRALRGSAPVTVRFCVDLVAKFGTRPERRWVTYFQRRYLDSHKRIRSRTLILLRVSEPKSHAYQCFLQHLDAYLYPTELTTV
jgi:hypothetical protein